MPVSSNDEIDLRLLFLPSSASNTRLVILESRMTFLEKCHLERLTSGFSTSCRNVLTVILLSHLVTFCMSHQLSSAPKHSAHQKFTVEQLMLRTFQNKISDDVFMDPCKSGKILFFKMRSRKRFVVQKMLNV